MLKRKYEVRQDCLNQEEEKEPELQQEDEVEKIEKKIKPNSRNQSSPEELLQQLKESVCVVHLDNSCLQLALLQEQEIYICKENMHPAQYICDNGYQKLQKKQCPICKSEIVSIDKFHQYLLKIFLLQCKYCKEKLTLSNFVQHQIEQFSEISCKVHDKCITLQEYELIQPLLQCISNEKQNLDGINNVSNILEYLKKINLFQSDRILSITAQETNEKQNISEVPQENKLEQQRIILDCQINKNCKLKIELSKESVYEQGKIEAENQISVEQQYPQGNLEINILFQPIDILVSIIVLIAAYNLIKFLINLFIGFPY